MTARTIEAPYGSTEVRIPAAELWASPNGAAALTGLTEQARSKAGSRTITGRYGYKRDGADYVFTFPLMPDPNAEQAPPLVLTDAG